MAPRSPTIAQNQFIIRMILPLSNNLAVLKKSILSRTFCLKLK